MSEVLVARQPILDRKLELAGYELLFRDVPVPTDAAMATPEGTTAKVLLDTFTEIGIERIVGAHTAWVNVDREFLLNGRAQSLPPGLVLLEILEDQLIDDKLILAIGELRKQGYVLALDDFEYSPSAEPLLELVDVVKLDFLALGRKGLSRQVERLKPHGVKLLAEKVETQEDFAYCAEAGCELFQGYFFCRPELVRGTRVDTGRLSLLEVLAALQDPAVELGALEQMIARDLRLSYRLLRYINSAFFGLRQEVRSIGQALALIGAENLKHWAALSVFASVDDRPSELSVTALVRARFCELAGGPRPRATRSELFTLGLFSLIDALMGMPIEEALAGIPFPEDLRAALTTHHGEKGRLLECVAALERGDFDGARSIVPNAGELYLAAVGWANEATKEAA
ncbi:MAG TPA: HDOD domain-containing protein [Solirubrobacteraceae bacterium]|nr:HDOD domain-containing protein [Solirubrobacteraceae bacterium]